MFAISLEVSRHNFHTEQGGALGITSYRTGPSPRQPVFNWTAKDKYLELENFKMEVTEIFPTNVYDISETENATMIQNGLGREGR